MPHAPSPQPSPLGTRLNPLTDPNARLVIGHRGNRAHAPENTIESLGQAIALGADALEFDVHLTADGVAVVMHDPTLDRTTDRRGVIARMRYEEVAAADAGARFTPDGGNTFPWRGKGLHAPRLEDVLDLARETPVLIELKTPAVQEETLRQIRRFNIAHRTLVDSMHFSALNIFRGSDVATGATARGVRQLLQKAILGRRIVSPEYQAMCVTPRYGALPLPVARFARMLREAGTALHVWTVNEERVAERLWRAGVNGIITDDPARMMALRSRIGSDD